ncbi:MAG TPA: hypothetical protein VLA42_18240 [Verrucomicrobiae bacterium]|jgi:hypothetical protein|nr:hypothetical protein [Verrucomicrobiae bacterium]
MSDSDTNTTIPTPDELTLASDALWNSIRETVVPLAQLIVAKRQQFQEAASSPTLDAMYRQDALRQVEQLSQAENSLMYGLQLFKQALYVRYLTPETKPSPTPKPQEQEEFFLARLNETLVN